MKGEGVNAVRLSPSPPSSHVYVNVTFAESRDTEDLKVNQLHERYLSMNVSI